MALDIILEEEAVKQSGDAWRIVLDSCLPVLHLIDINLKKILSSSEYYNIEDINLFLRRMIRSEKKRNSYSTRSVK